MSSPLLIEDIIARLDRFLEVAKVDVTILPEDEDGYKAPRKTAISESKALRPGRVRFQRAR